jgi:hypothetical protein
VRGVDTISAMTVARTRWMPKKEIIEVSSLHLETGGAGSSGRGKMKGGTGGAVLDYAAWKRALVFLLLCTYSLGSSVYEWCLYFDGGLVVGTWFAI